MTSTTTCLIEEPAVLDALPAGTEVRDADGDTGTKTRDGSWKVAGFPWGLDPDWFTFPVRVVRPTKETAQLVTDLGEAGRVPAIMAELRSIVGEIQDRFEKQTADLNELRDENGDVPRSRLIELDELMDDIHEEDTELLTAVLERLESLVGSGQGGA
ncbi:hypothetical protein [Streptomyces sp. CC210A]|uniref:hypothetical protein n=1 Tax=Streptomyces sp. CC210A TaxID=2898184 RepID=UPI001F206F3C|nr:hypothetical protein [Streptomyces sp. CC210A]